MLWRSTEMILSYLVSGFDTFLFCMYILPDKEIKVSKVEEPRWLQDERTGYRGTTFSKQDQPKICAVVFRCWVRVS